MRGYDRAIIRGAFARVESLSREDTLEKVVRPEHERITLVIPFDKRLPNIATASKSQLQQDQFIEGYHCEV